MFNKLPVIRSWIFAIASLLLLAGSSAAAFPQTTQRNKPELGSADARDIRRMDALKEEVRHQLVMLAHYSVFDWLAAQVQPDGTVTLTGDVTRPTLKDAAENRVKSIESATRVVNNIEILPLSPMDDELRLGLFRALFRSDSPLFRYATQSVPPIHIIVKNGRVSLKGMAQSQFDSQFAETAARSVPGSFEVRNELQIEQRVDEKVSSR